MKTLVDRDYTKHVIELHRSHKRVYRIVYFGRQFYVYPHVFSPKYAFSSCAVTKEVLQHQLYGNVLDMGTGIGVQAIFAAISGAHRVLAVDINPMSVSCAEANVKLHDLEEKIKVKLSNLYSSITQSEKFDFIIADLPFVSGEPQDMLERAFYSPENRTIREFFRQTPRYLAPGGMVLTTFSSLDDGEWFMDALAKYDYSIQEQKSNTLDGQQWYVFWLTPLSEHGATKSKLVPTSVASREYDMA